LQNDYLASEFRDVSIVLVDTAYPEQKRPYVIFDNTRLGSEMTRLLVKRGHRNITFMMLEAYWGAMKHRSTLDRYQGYLSAARENGIVARHWLVPTANIRDLEPHVVQWLTAWKGQDPHTRPSAIITLHDHIAIVLSSIAQEMGISVPDELEFVGFDNHPIGHSFYPRFVTSDPDFVRAGEIATELALRFAIEENRENVCYVLPVPILEKRSLASGASPRANALQNHH
jgi:DNA-binding LacI/PurR family transcriptional regulator